MREAFSTQQRLDAPSTKNIPLNFECRDEIVPILAGLQHIYMQPDLRSKILTLVENDVNEHTRNDAGRTGMGYWQMIWATFEHTDNAPDADYYYLNADGEVTLKKNWNADGTPIEKDWLFMDGVSKRQSNQMRMELKGNAILATPNKTIGAANTSRTHPWGNVDTEESAANNTAIISLNDSIRSQLAAGDVRANYLLIGATWTRNGVPGVGLQIPVVAGSLTLANSSMETYFQFKNCFGCHQGGKLKGLSHIFGSIKPLPKAAN